MKSLLNNKIFLFATLATGALANTCLANTEYVYLSTATGIKEFTPGGTAETLENSVGVTGLVFGSNGDLYADSFRQFVYEVGPGGVTTTFANSVGLLNGNLGMVFDASGNLYVGQDFSNSLTKITPAGTTSAFTGNLGNGPFGTAIDGSGDFFSTLDNGQIEEVTPAGSGSTYKTGFSDTRGIAFDSSGDLFVSDIGTDRIDELALGSSTFTVFATVTGAPVSLAFDSAGNLFVTDQGTQQILEFAAGSNTSTVFASGIGANNTSYLAISSEDLVGAPEPATWSMVALGVVALMIGRRKSKRKDEQRAQPRSGC